MGSRSKSRKRRALRYAENIAFALIVIAIGAALFWAFVLRPAGVTDRVKGIFAPSLKLGGE